MKQRKQIQGILGFMLGFIFIFSNYLPLIISSYLVLIYMFLSFFHHIKDIEENEDDEVPYNATDSIISLLFQLISFALVFLFTWVLLDWKLELL
ncbi:MAG: hypothetical protein H0V30_02505 [Chitinophagaceae bacterium]|nr:hypothetical protein [Chitinophagaceae bacterium]